jgi:uncharacterized alpha-E superfamily protein
MLSRVADSLYWLGRYLERAEHTARMAEVNLGLLLESTAVPMETRMARLLRSLHDPLDESVNAADPEAVSRALLFDLSTRASIASCISLARENARQVREQISSEMWEELNRYYLAARVWDGSEAEYLLFVRRQLHLFDGVTASTLPRGEGWYFLRAGRFLERAISIARFIETFLRTQQSPPDHLELAGFLRCCTAYEAACKTWTASLNLDQACAYLIMESGFPHSLRFCFNEVKRALERLPSPEGQDSNRAVRLAARLDSQLGYGSYDDLRSSGLENWLEDTQRQAYAIHNAILTGYVDYSIARSLSA